MNHKRSFLLLALLACLIVGTIVLAAPEGGAAINWWTVDSGGGQSSGGPYVLMGTAGQPDVSVQNGGTYVLASGFWTPEITGSYEIFLPVITK